MALEVPGDQTSAPQVWQGHAPVPTWETPMYRVGRQGLNLVDARDDLDPAALARSVNVVSRFGGPLQTRPGQAALGTTSGTDLVHSLYRLNDPGASTFTRLAGSSTALYRGQSGALASVDTGYSGDPLTFAGLTVPLTGTPYVVIADRSRQRKLSRTGSIELFGIPPATLTSTALVAQLTTGICQFEAADPDGASAAANWTKTAGQDRSGNATGTPTATDVMGAGDLLVQVTTDPTGAAAGVGYDSIISIARTLNLALVGGQAASDDDMIHLRINVSNPLYLEEIKVYFVCSTFTAGAIPGDSTNNTQAFFKAIRPNDFQPFHSRQVSSTTASTQLQENELLQFFKDDNSSSNTKLNQEVTAGVTDINRLAQPAFPAGQNVWGEFGILGIPLRRGDFARVGVTEVNAPTWSTITGIVIVIQTNTDQPLVVTFADWSLDGGSGPDVSEPDSQSYDYRVINYNPITGSKGNPSAIQAEANWLNPVRQSVTITPAASGITGMRQWAFRRGGSALTTQNWYFVGENASDGGTITDTLSDDEIVQEETLEIDNDQPVTSTDASGNTVLNQTLPVYFPFGGYMFGLGDTYQPGRLYRSKLGNMEAWPSTEYDDVCATSDELMNGGSYASMGFVFSRQQMYAILLNADGSWTTEPTGCREGLVGRWGMCVTPFGVAFVSPFGIRLTNGTGVDGLSNDQIAPLFKGETVNGMYPVQLTVPTALRLEYHDSELWFSYLDLVGVRRQLIYNFFDKTWRSYLFATEVAHVYSEPVQGTAASLLMGSTAAGALYTHAGYNDLGSAIAYSFRTGTWTFGNPRIEKLLAEVILDAELQAATVSLGTYLNDETTTNTAMTVVGSAGMRRYYWEPFGIIPQHARNVSVEFSGDAPLDAPLQFNGLGVTIQQQPEITYKEPSPWEELPGGEGYCFGMLLTCDTGNVAKTIVIEYTVNNGSVTTAATLTVTADGRRKLPFTWSAVLAQQIRLRPTGDCEPWMRFKIEWLTDREPPRVKGWDTNWQTFGTLSDKWLKGVLIEADTFNLAKTVVMDIDQSLAAVAVGSLTFNGRGIQQISFAKQRGRVFRLRATDDNFGKLFQWIPIFDEEPLALTRWESEERPFPGMDGRWQKPLDAWVTIRSSASVSWQVTTYGSGTTALDTSTYTIPSTGGVKQKARVPMNAVKGLLFQHLFTSASPFWLYREESEVLVEDFNTGEARWVSLFIANDDLDPARGMGNPVVAAATPGGA